MAAPAPSSVNTVGVPVQGQDPALLARAAAAPLRVVVRNVGGSPLIIAMDASALQSVGPLAGTFRLPTGQESTFVLMAKQSILAVSSGAGGLASIAISEALPQVWMEA